MRRFSRSRGLDVRILHSPHDLDGATSVAIGALSTDRPPTAFFCLADSMAYGVYAAADDLGLEIPRDVSVLGYDDHPVSRVLSPPLSNFRWPVDEVVSYAVERAVRAVDEGRRSRRKLIRPEARPRGSVASPTG